MPITPVGPRLIHPAVNNPGTGRPPGASSTRPPELGMVEVASSNGTPGRAAERYPTALYTASTGRSSVHPVRRTPAPSATVRSRRSPATRPSRPRISTGARWKRNRTTRPPAATAAASA